jgi:beta-glucuronidase
MKPLLTTALLLCFSVIYSQEFTKADPSLIGLYPQQNDLRNTINLSGIWQWKKDSLGIGEQENWQNGLQEARNIAVPGSWNEQFTDSRNYLGLAWYETETFVPSAWRGQRIFLRVGSANYAAKVWVNGQPVGQHEGGHLPFVFEIGSKLQWGKANRISISVENELKPSRVPTGNVPGGVFSNYPKSNYDFFPYAGLQRDVWLYSLPASSSIKDITVTTDFENSTGSIKVEVVTEGDARQGQVTVSGNGQNITAPLSFANNAATATLSIPSVRLWSMEDPFLYQIEVTIGNAAAAADRYILETGVRTVSVSDKAVLLNGEPVFLKGFGKHEDFPIFGKGTARPVMVKDFALLKWIGANSFRTSHYPYDEDYLRMADREGFLIIDETPSVGLYFHGDAEDLAQRQEMCKQYINEMITRDKNHPSVIMWCVANEPFPENMNVNGGSGGRVATPESVALFQEMYDLVKARDQTRPATMVGVMGGPAEWISMWDVICINRYYGWYTHLGEPEAGAKLLGMELDGLYQRYQKPIIVTEFGADTYPGMHATETEMFTEEFQTLFLKLYLDVADARDFVTGMHVWAFSDFKTSQGLIRFGGMNYKGVFTQDRKPKAAAHFLRSRWNK